MSVNSCVTVKVYLVGFTESAYLGFSGLTDSFKVMVCVYTGVFSESLDYESDTESCRSMSLIDVSC